MDHDKAILVLGDDTLSLKIRKWTPYTENLARQVFDVLGKTIFKANKSGVEELNNMKDAKQELSLTTKLRSINANRQDRTEKGHFKEIMQEELLLKRYGRMPVYKPLLDHILQNTKATFTAKEMASLIDKYYFHVLKRAITYQSAQAYASVYGRYMGEQKLVIRDLKKGYYEKTAEKKIQATSEQIANEIMMLALRKRWITIKQNVEISVIKQELNKYAGDDIERGLAKLVEYRKIYQVDKQKVSFVFGEQKNGKNDNTI